MAPTKTPEGQILSQSLGAFRRSATRSQRRFTPYRRAVTSRKRTVPLPVKVHTFRAAASRPSSGRAVSSSSGRVVSSSAGRAVSSSSGRAVSSDNTDTESSITKDMINKTWRLYRASPLYNVSYKPAHFKQYGRALAFFIESESKKGTAISADGGRTKVAEFTSICSLRTSAVDRDAIKICVKNREKDAKGKETLHISAYLCCTDIKGEVDQAMSKDFTYLPVIMIKGSVFMTQTLIAFLQKRFDCVIREMTFSSTDLHWMFAINAAFLPEKLEKKVSELVYSVSDDVKGINKITFSIDAKHCQQLIKCACGDESTDLTQSQKDKFILALEQHFKAHFMINLNVLKLERVTTAVSVLGAEGRLKMYSPDHVMQVLSYLTTLCCEHFQKVAGIL